MKNDANHETGSLHAAKGRVQAAFYGCGFGAAGCEAVCEVARAAFFLAIASRIFCCCSALGMVSHTPAITTASAAM